MILEDIVESTKERVETDIHHQKDKLFPLLILKQLRKNMK